MIDVFAVLFSVGGVLFVTFRAILLDRTLPWFTPVPPASDPAGQRRAERL